MSDLRTVDWLGFRCRKGRKADDADEVSGSIMVVTANTYTADVAT